jgi:2-oxoglutarate/2-oxoacid ferredoxin oxidoreductase subunit beta
MRIVIDNHVYGMTKGQASPTTEPDWDNKLSPGGASVRSFLPLVIALASGASFVARAFAGDPNGTADIIAQAIVHDNLHFGKDSAQRHKSPYNADQFLNRQGDSK